MKKPNNLEEALQILNTKTDKESIERFKNLSDGNEVHFTFGMWLRNNWGLWRQDTAIVQWFKKTYGIIHADDISGIILDTWHRELNGKPRRDKELAKKFIAHWKKSGGM